MELYCMDVFPCSLCSRGTGPGSEWSPQQRRRTGSGQTVQETGGALRPRVREHQTAGLPSGLRQVGTITSTQHVSVWDFHILDRSSCQTVFKLSEWVNEWVSEWGRFSAGKKTKQNNTSFNRKTQHEKPQCVHACTLICVVERALMNYYVVIMQLKKINNNKWRLVLLFPFP